MRAAWILVVVAASCMHRRPSDEEQLLIDGLAAADAAWANRANGGLSAVHAALDRVAGPRAADPRVRWRRARVYVAEGLASPDPLLGQRRYALARAEGLACLSDDRAIRSEVARVGWGPAAGLISPGRLPCAAWAAMAWARWQIGFGPAASEVDDGTVAALTLAGMSSVDGDVHDVAAWAEGLRAASAAAAPEGVRRRGVALLVDAARRGQARDDAWVRWTDLLRFAPAEAAALGPPARPPEVPEELAVAPREG